jgi:hypothetical protein
VLCPLKKRGGARTRTPSNVRWERPCSSISIIVLLGRARWLVSPSLTLISWVLFLNERVRKTAVPRFTTESGSSVANLQISISEVSCPSDPSCTASGSVQSCEWCTCWRIVAMEFTTGSPSKHHLHNSPFEKIELLGCDSTPYSAGEGCQSGRSPQSSSLHSAIWAVLSSLSAGGRNGLKILLLHNAASKLVTLGDPSPFNCFGPVQQLFFT